MWDFAIDHIRMSVNHVDKVWFISALSGHLDWLCIESYIMFGKAIMCDELEVKWQIKKRIDIYLKFTRLIIKIKLPNVLSIWTII